MKLTCKYLKRVTTESNECEATFSLPHYQSKWLDELDKTKEYNIEIKEIKSQRSIKQNNLMWAIINEIAKEKHEDEMKIYCDALEEANAKYEYIMGLPTIENELKKNFRAVKVVRPEEHNGKQFIVYKCYIGSSKYSVEEMTLLLEIVLKYASEYGVDVRKYEE